MMTFLEALSAGDWKYDIETGTIYKWIGDIQICLEPLIFDSQFYLAVYDKNLNLLFPKIPMKPGKE